MADPASGLASYADFQNTTRARNLTGRDQILNQSLKYRSWWLSMVMKREGSLVYLPGGTEINERTILSSSTTFAPRSFNTSIDYTTADVTNILKAQWRLVTTHSQVNKWELELNNAKDELSAWKDLEKIKGVQMDQSFFEGMEAQAVAAPNYALMEGALPSANTPGLFNSIRCFITDDGELPSAGNGGIDASGGAWTTIMGVIPANFPNWKNQFGTFDNGSKTTREATFLDAMDDMFVACNFEAPNSRETYALETKFQKYVIVVNRATLGLLKRLIRQNNQQLPGNGDKNNLGYVNGQFSYNNVPIFYWSALDDIDTGADTGTTAKYRARFINLDTIKYVFKTGAFRNKEKLDKNATTPFILPMLESTVGNMICVARKLNGIVRAA